MECWGAHFLDLMDEAWGAAKLGEGRGGSFMRADYWTKLGRAPLSGRSLTS